MNVAQAIREKSAVRSFLPVPLPEDVVRSILNAGRRAQSAKNSQPWQFIAVRDRATLENSPAPGGMPAIWPGPRSAW